MDYPNKYLWELPMKGLRDDDGVLRENPQTLRQARLGSVWQGFDIEEHIASEDGAVQAEHWKNVITCSDEMAPQVLEYWEKLGWKKELHNVDNLPEKYSVFVPLSSLKEENKDRRYPLLFVLHGGNTPPYEMEGYGLVEPTAKDEAIVIIPQNFAWQNLIKLYKTMIDNYPVDRSRVYAISYCGGNRANQVGLLYPELFAAIAPCGNPLRENIKPVMCYADYERVRRICLPTIHIDGADDLTQLLPVYMSGDPARSEDPNYPGRTFDMPLAKREYKVNCLRDLLFIYGCRDVTPEEVYACEFSDDPVLRAVGAPADSTEIETIYGRKHYVASFRNADGNEWLKIASIESMGHFPNGSLGVLAWEFMRKFRRDPETGRISVEGEDTGAYAERDLGKVDCDRYLHDYGSREFGYNTAWKGHVDKKK